MGAGELATFSVVNFCRRWRSDSDWIPNGLSHRFEPREKWLRTPKWVRQARVLPRDLGEQGYPSLNLNSFAPNGAFGRMMRPITHARAPALTQRPGLRPEPPRRERRARARRRQTRSKHMAPNHTRAHGRATGPQRTPKREENKVWQSRGEKVWQSRGEKKVQPIPEHPRGREEECMWEREWGGSSNR